MAKKVLQVIESAYRATLEEQDDTVVWLTHSMKGAGGEFDVLLRGNAVNYAVRGQDASGLAFGDWKQTHSPRLAEDVTLLIGKGIQVHVVQEDAARLGLEVTDFIDGVKPIPQSSIPSLFSKYDQIWHW